MMGEVTTSHAAPVVRSRPSSGLAEVLDIILDRGLVIDVFVRVSVIGIELATVDARVVVAGVDTYLRFAEAVDRLNILATDESLSIGEVLSGR